MNATKQAIWLLLILILLSVSGWYFAGSPVIHKLDDQTLATTPDTIISNLTIQQFDAHGKLSHYLKTPRLQHVPQNDTHQIQTPHMIIIQPGQPAWEVDAREAIALHGGEQITLSHDVIIHKNEHEQNTTLVTDELIWFPRKQLAITSKKDTHVRLDQGTSHIRAASIKTRANTRNQLVEAIIRGDRLAQAHYWTQQENNKAPVHARADIMKYYPEQHLLKLIGNAMVTRDTNSFSAAEIIYNIKTQRVESKPAGKSRTTIIFRPGKDT